MSQGILTTPDYSGLIYDFDGHTMSLQVAPKPTTSNATSIMAPTPPSASTGRNSLTRWLASLFDSSESYKPYFFELLKRSLSPVQSVITRHEILVLCSTPASLIFLDIHMLSEMPAILLSSYAMDLTS